jgi:hypothetical protein
LVLVVLAHPQERLEQTALTQFLTPLLLLAVEVAVAVLHQAMSQ